MIYITPSTLIGQVVCDDRPNFGFFHLRFENLTMDYEEEQAQELEILTSIYDEEEFERTLCLS